MKPSNSDQQQTPGAELRTVMRYWGSGVAVAAAVYQDVQHGMTVSSFTSLSLDPPLVAVSLEQSARTYQLVADSQAFSVTILAEDQQAISNRFAGRETEEQDRFAGLQTYTLVSGSPLLVGGLAGLDCRVAAVHPVGTHMLVIGEVVATQVSSDQAGMRPLLYFNRAYQALGELGG